MKSKNSLPQSRAKRKYNSLLRDNPKLLPFLLDTIEYTRKWQTPQIADTFDLARQTLEHQLDMRQAKEKKNGKK